MIKEVLQRFSVNHGFFWDLCYEWNEEFAKYFGVPVRQITIGTRTTSEQTSGSRQKNPSIARKVIHFVSRFPAVKNFIKDVAVSVAPPLHQNIAEPLSLGITFSPLTTDFMRGTNCIPMFMDVFSKADFASVMRQTKGFKLFYVTAREVFDRIKAKDPSSGVHYMPQSIADKYHSENFTAYRNKFIDVFMPARGNLVLHEYMLRYAAEHPNIKYVYRSSGPTLGTWQCRSTDGSISLPLNTREEYQHVLSSAKVALVGCSGIDNSRPEAYGICFVTPRFYECAILGCALIGRYPDNEEFTELNMHRYCPHITSYEHFCTELERALAQTPEQLYAQNHDFIINSLTSKRAEQILHDLEALS